jgi:hypothetical protein
MFKISVGKLSKNKLLYFNSLVLVLFLLLFALQKNKKFSQIIRKLIS